MSINYDWYSTPKKNENDEVRLHVRPAFNGSITTDDIAGSIQTATSLTKADVLAVLKALNQEMSRQLANGCRKHPLRSGRPLKRGSEGLCVKFQFLKILTWEGFCCK